MRFEFETLHTLPRLAWVAALRRGARAVHVLNGPWVETRGEHFFEGAWDGPVEPGAFDEAITFAGSGGASTVSGSPSWARPTSSSGSSRSEWPTPSTCRTRWPCCWRVRARRWTSRTRTIFAISSSTSARESASSESPCPWGAGGPSTCTIAATWSRRAISVCAERRSGFPLIRFLCRVCRVPRADRGTGGRQRGGSRSDPHLSPAGSRVARV